MGQIQENLPPEPRRPRPPPRRRRPGRRRNRAPRRSSPPKWSRKRTRAAAARARNARSGPHTSFSRKCRDRKRLFLSRVARVRPWPQAEDAQFRRGARRPSGAGAGAKPRFPGVGAKPRFAGYSSRSHSPLTPRATKVNDTFTATV